MDLVWSGSNISNCKPFHNIPLPVDEILQEFTNLKYEQAKIEFVSNLQTKKLFNDVQGIKKSTELSAQLRSKGNGYYKDKKFTEALRAYNLALCFSPPDSSEFYFAVANRSAIYFELHQFNLCKSDVGLVLETKIGSPEIAHLKSKLQSRMQRCQELEEILEEEKNPHHIAQSQCKTTKLEYFSLSNRNGAIPSAEDFIDIRTSESRGRHVVTKKFIPAGTVLILEDPFAKILLDQFRWDVSHCHTCLGPISNGIPCDSCVFAIFCSPTCRDAQDVYMCQSSSYLHSINPSRTLLLATKIITKLGPTKLYELFLHPDPPPPPTTTNSTTTSSEQEVEPLGFVDGVYASDNYHTILNLIYHKVSSLELFQYIVEACAVTEALWCFSNFFESHRDVNFRMFVCELIVLHLQNLPPNAHSINKLISLDLVEYGAGAYSLLSLINHSCDPNVTRFNLRHGRVAVVTIKSVASGAELLDNYGVHYAVNEYEERQKHLSEHYYFTCDCQACIFKWPLFHTLKQNQTNNLSSNLLANSSLSYSQVDMVNKKFDFLFTKIMNGDEDINVVELIECLRIYETCFKLPFVKFNEAQETFKHYLNTIIRKYCYEVNL